MKELSDAELLREFLEGQSEDAFSEIVCRYVDLVHSAALRMVRDSHMAEDVTQGVFIALAGNAAKLTNRSTLAGWLHRTARNQAANAVRTEVRRRAREEAAVAMSEREDTNETPPWEELAPHLDEALNALKEADRDAVLLRYFQGKSARQIAEVLGTSQGAALKRIDRAVARLRALLARRGIDAGASGLAASIASHGVHAAPAGIAASILQVVVNGDLASTTASALASTKTFALNTAQKCVVGAALFVTTAAGFYSFTRPAPVQAPSTATPAFAKPPVATPPVATTTTPPRPSRIYVVAPDGSNLRMVADDTALAGRDMLGSPSWSHDGMYLLFDATRRTAFSSAHIGRITLTGPDAGKVEDMGFGLGGVYSPNDGQIAFYMNDKNPDTGQSGLYRMNPDGSGRTRLGPGLYPQWSPDGTQIVAVNTHGSPRAYYFYNVDPWTERRVVTMPIVLGLPTWAPDSKRIAVTLLVGNKRALSILNAGADTDSPVELWRGNWDAGYEETWPDWSVDDRLAFTRFTDGGSEIVLLEARPGAEPRVVDLGGGQVVPRDCAWSPDAKLIAFASLGPQILSRSKPFFHK